MQKQVLVIVVINVDRGFTYEIWNRHRRRFDTCETVHGELTDEPIARKRPHCRAVTQAETVDDSCRRDAAIDKIRAKVQMKLTVRANKQIAISLRTIARKHEQKLAISEGEK